jgi:pimeloyl-ACP methyl ester carboxylesterase
MLNINTNIYMNLVKIFGLVIIALLAIWLIGSMYLTGQAGSMVFNNVVSWAPVPNYGYNQEFITNSSGQRVEVWSFISSSTSDQYLLYLHGNAGRLPNFFPQLTTKFNVVSPSYPGYHASESKPTVENVYDTALVTYDYLVNTKKIPEDKITIFGHSMGGSPAIYLAANRPKAKKLVIVNTFSSIQSMCFKQYSIFCAFAGNIFNSASNASKVTMPVRQFAYKNDTTVPFEEGKTLYTYFTGSNDKAFFEMDKTTHSYPDFELILKEI